jgi:hypothetical protein
MRQMLRSSLCVVVLTSAMAMPSRVSAQTINSQGGLLEVGAVLNHFPAIADDPAALVGPRVSAEMAPKVSLQFDLRVFTGAWTDGLYTIRLRFMPLTDSSSWYVFGGVGGLFALAESGGIRGPMLLNGGVGHRFAGRGPVSASMEGEVWSSWMGGLAGSVSFGISYGSRVVKHSTARR